MSYRGRSNSLLLVSYYFPPLGMGGVQRVASLAGYLTRLGWQVAVLTVRPFGYPAYDYSIAEHLPRSVRIYRAGCPEQMIMRRPASWKGRIRAQNGSGSLFSRLGRWAMLPDSKVLSALGMLRRVGAVMERTRPTVVITTSPPPSIHLVGLYLKRYYGARWVADFRDVWFSQSRVPYRTPLHRSIHRHLERACVESADRTVVVSAGHLELLRRRYPASADRQFLISNGYEEDVFADIPPSFDAGGDFRFGYCGTLNHLTHVPGLLEMFMDVSRDHPLSLDICGFVSAELRALIGRLDPEGSVIRLSGYRDHRDAVEFRMRCAANLVTLAPDSNLELTVPGKVYEMLRVPKPVIGVVPGDSSAWRFLSQFEGVELADASDMAGLRSAVIGLVERGRAETAVRRGIGKFSWSNLMDQYDRLLREISGC